jgi:hypothetical protein
LTSICAISRITIATLQYSVRTTKTQPRASVKKSRDQRAYGVIAWRALVA